jgi:hypothetical protein
VGLSPAVTYTRTAWALRRYAAPDYSRMEYPLRKLSAQFNPHLRCFLMSPGLPQRVELFDTREQARSRAKGDAAGLKAVCVRITIEEAV